MQKALKALPLNSKLINVKPGNYFKGYVSNLTHNQKIQNKNNLCVYLKRKILHFQSQGV